MTEITEHPVTPSWERALEFVLRFLGAAFPFLVPYLTCFYLLPFVIQAWPYDHMVLELSVFIVATVAGLIAALYWTWKEEKVNTARIHYRLQLVVRFFLVYIFLTYGIAKLYRTQFYDPYQQWLDTPLGELSGFALTWSYFGTSFAYSAFIGLSQILCSLLLCFRKTQLVGALILLPIIGNIVIVNFAYDVPVQVYSSAYLVMVVYLVLSDFRRLKTFFWDNATVGPRRDPEVRVDTKRRYYVLKYATMAAIAVSTLWKFETLTTQMPYVEHPVFGIWEVESYESDAEVMFRRQEPGDVWTKLVFEAHRGGNRANVKIGNETSQVANYEVGGDRNLKITFPGNKDSESFEGLYELNDGGMILTGKIGEKPVQMALRRKEYSP